VQSDGPVSRLVGRRAAAKHCSSRDRHSAAARIAQAGSQKHGCWSRSAVVPPKPQPVPPERHSVPPMLTCRKRGQQRLSSAPRNPAAAARAGAAWGSCDAVLLQEQCMGISTSGCNLRHAKTRRTARRAKLTGLVGVRRPPETRRCTRRTSARCWAPDGT
jgi:hypothetical protein